MILAAALRTYGIGHDLPFVYNPDEANIMARTLGLARDPNPHYFLYPSFFFYAIFGVIGLLFLVGRLAGRYPSLGAFERRFFEDATDFFLAGRLVGVAAALATVVLTYHLAARRFGRTAARAASLFLAVAYFHVRDSHYLKHDVAASLLVIVALVAFDRAMERGSPRAYFASGGAMGMAFATHYYTIFLAPAFVLCHLASAGLRRLGLLAASAVTSAATFFALSPFVILDFPRALEHMRANREVVVDRSLASGAIFFPSFGSYVRLLAEQGLGYLLLALVLAGAFLMARRGAGTGALWGGFPLPFFLFITYTYGPGRYLNPILPVLAVAGGVAIAGIASRLGRFAAAGLALAAAVQPLYRDLQVNRLFAGEDTRTLARQWILENVPDGESIALQSYSVPLPQSLESLRESLEAHQAAEEISRRGKFSHLAALAAKGRPGYQLYFIGRGDEKDRLYFDYQELLDGKLEPLHARGVRLVVLSHPPGAPPAPVRRLFDEVSRQGRPVALFSPVLTESANLPPYLDNEDWPPRPELARKGPRVEVWSLEKR